MAFSTKTKVKALEKFKDDIVKVKFSDVSHYLLTSEILTKEECFDIFILPGAQQMKACLAKITAFLEEKRDEDNQLWECLLRALKAEHPSLASKVEDECKKINKENRSSKLRKEDISAPTNFRHIQHMGWTPQRGFSVTGIDADYKTFFEQAGVTEDHMNDETTREFIFNFIEKNGGEEAVRREARSSSGSSVAGSPLDPNSPDFF